MAGLLDFLSSDDGALGVGLLAAGGPVSDPNASGFGARIANAVNYAQGSKAAGMRNKLLQSQIDENATQAAQRQAALDRQARMDNYYLGGGFGAAAAPAAGPVGAAGGNVPEGAVLKQAVGAPADAPRPPQGKFAEWSKQFNIPVDSLISDYISNGGKGIAEMLFKAGRPDIKVQDGYAYDANRTQPGFLPGITTSADGTSTLRLPDAYAPGGVRVMAPQGALEAAGAYGTQKARTNAAFTPGRPTIMEGGRMGGQSQLDEINGGRPAPAPAAGTRPLIGPGYAGGSAGAAAGGQADILSSELTKAQGELAAAQQRGDAAGVARAQADIAGLQRELSRLPRGAAPTPAPLIGPGAGRGSAKPVQGGGLEFSPAEKATQAAEQTRQVDTAKADVVRDTDTQKKAKSATAMIQAADRAIELLKKGPTSSGLGELVDKGANFFGQSSKGAEIASQLDIVAGDLVNNVPRMEGPQSDGDRLEYKLQAGRAADRSIPIPQRIAAAEEVKRLQTKYARFNGGDAPAPNTGGASGSWAPPAGWTVKVK